MSALNDGGQARARPWEWAMEEVSRAVGQVRAGPSLAPSGWLGGARVAVALSFDPDHETVALRDGDTGVGALAAGEYGSRVGAPRILALLESSGIPATFFMPAVSALLHPEEVSAYVGGGHEVALHGWIHERLDQLSPAEERELAHRSADALERLCGTRPVGLRTPSWDFTGSTLGLIQELGLEYDSSLMADDEPYEILQDGQPTGVVEIPVEWVRDDYPYLASGRLQEAPRQVLGVWRDEFDAAYAAGGLFQLTCHPHVIGHRSRLVVLEELIAHIRSHSGVWFATHAEVARYVRPPAGTDQQGLDPL
jgi:peptidoglycan/xylan/chitin deacetylase (PgdA/CDA1 family)